MKQIKFMTDLPPIAYQVITILAIMIAIYFIKDFKSSIKNSISSFKDEIRFIIGTFTSNINMWKEMQESQRIEFQKTAQEIQDSFYKVREDFNLTKIRVSSDLKIFEKEFSFFRKEMTSLTDQTKNSLIAMRDFNGKVIHLESELDLIQDHINKVEKLAKKNEKENEDNLEYIKKSKEVLFAYRGELDELKKKAK